MVILIWLFRYYKLILIQITVTGGRRPNTQLYLKVINRHNQRLFNFLNNIFKVAATSLNTNHVLYK